MKSRTGIVLFASIFAVGFGAGGFVGLSSLAGQLTGWWQARNWQAVSAAVIDATLKTSHDETTTYQATARYRYTFDGQSYDGTQVGFSRGFDNVGSWQRDHYTRLIDAKHDGRAIEIWVDPENPARSVIDRNIRWSMIAFSLPFATVFPLISIGALWIMFRTLRTPAQEFSAPPKLERNASEIKSDALAGARMLWAFAIVWGMIAFPVAFVVVPEQFGRSWIWLMVMLFPLIGVALIWTAAARTIRLVRHGEVTLALSPTELRLGESMTVQAGFTRMPPAGEYAVSLLCEKVDTRGEDTSYRTLWKQERVMQVNGMHAATSFSPPAALPSSQPPTDIYHRWRVLLSFPDKKDERCFDVVIGPSRDGVTAQADANEHTDVLSSDGIAFPTQSPSSKFQASPIARSATQEAHAVRIRNRVVTGVKVLGALMLLAVFWDFFGTQFFEKETASTADGEVEAPRKAGSNKPKGADRALFRAIGQDNAVDAIASALAEGANVNATNEWGATPLLMAARSGNPEAVRALIRAGSNIDFSVTDDNEYRGRTPLMDAATSGNGETVAVLLEAGANAQAFENHGWSALHYAAHRGNLEALRAFQRHHVDIDLRSPESRGATPLMIAARFGKLDSIGELIKLGADARAKDRYGENVYSWARFFDQSAAMEALSAYR